MRVTNYVFWVFWGIFLYNGLHAQQHLPHAIYRLGGLERADTTIATIHLVFTGGDYNDEGKTVRKILKGMSESEFGPTTKKGQPDLKGRPPTMDNPYYRSKEKDS